MNKAAIPCSPICTHLTRDNRGLAAGSGAWLSFPTSGVQLRRGRRQLGRKQFWLLFQAVTLRAEEKIDSKELTGSQNHSMAEDGVQLQVLLALPVPAGAPRAEPRALLWALCTCPGTHSSYFKL